MTKIGQLAGTLFSSGSADDVMLVDPKEVVSNAPHTKYVSKVTDTLHMAADFIAENPNIINEAMDLTSSLKGGGLSPKDKLAKLDGLFSKHGVSISNLSGDMQSKMMSYIPDGAKDMVSKVGIGIGDAYGVYDTVKNISDVQGALSALERYTGEFGLGDVFDFSAEIAFLKTINDEMVMLGHPGILDVINERLQSDPSGKLKQDYYVASWESYVQMGDVDQMQRILDDIEPDIIMGYHPNTIRTLLSRYRLPLNVTYADHADLKDKLLGVLNTLDINWGKYLRNGVWIWDLDAFSQASHDTTTLFEQDETYRVPVTIGRSYGTRDIVETIQGMYRNYHFTINTA